MTSPYFQPNNETQTGAVYKNNLDNAAAVFSRLAAAFHVQAQNIPDMTVLCLGGARWNGLSLDEMAPSSSAAIVAPVTHPRIDRVVLDPLSGAISVVTGVEDSDPEVPVIPPGKQPLARIALVPAQTVIVNADIADERVLTAGKPRDNYDASVDPDPLTDDITAGYGVGSRWFNSTITPPATQGEAFLCVDASAGAAQWVKISLTADELKSAAFKNTGTGIGDIPELVNDGSGNAALPAVSGRNLTDLVVPGRRVASGVHTSSFTWNKPSGLSASAKMLIRLQAAGGGGSGRGTPSHGGDAAHSLFGSLLTVEGGKGSGSWSRAGASVVSPHFYQHFLIEGEPGSAEDGLNKKSGGDGFMGSGGLTVAGAGDYDRSYGTGYGGGAGRYSTASGGIGNGGSAGGYFEGWIDIANVPSSVSVTIGAPGAGGSGSSNTGSNGRPAIFIYEIYD